MTTEPRLGCDLTAHRDLGFCAYCPGKALVDEVVAWRVLAMKERGVPPQPGAHLLEEPRYDAVERM